VREPGGRGLACRHRLGVQGGRRDGRAERVAADLERRDRKRHTHRHLGDADGAGGHQAVVGGQRDDAPARDGMSLTVAMTEYGWVNTARNACSGRPGVTDVVVAVDHDAA